MSEKIAVIQKRYVLTHPYVSYLAMFIGIPVVLLLSVALLTTAVSLPLALIFQWI